MTSTPDPARREHCPRRAPLWSVSPVDLLGICRTCGEVVGESDGWPRTCDCHPACRLVKPPAEGPRRLFLCHGCAGRVREDFSRWSVFYCGPCGAEVRALNSSLGRVLVPLGRHSIVNASTVGGAPLPAQPAEVLALLDHIGRLAGPIAEWRRSRTLHNARGAGLDLTRDIPLREYVAAVELTDDQCRDAFRTMVAHLGVNLLGPSADA